MTAGLTLPSHRHLARRDVRRLVPALSGDAVTGGVQFYDAQVDDARLAVTVVRTASAYGAAVVNRLEVLELQQCPDRVRGVRVRDRMTGRELDLAARVVVLATGHEAALGVGPGDRRTWAPSQVRQRVHLVVARSAIRSATGLAFPGEGLGLIRVTPWGRHWLIGPVETDQPAADEAPTVASSDVDLLLAAVNVHLPNELTRDQVQACYAGMAHDPSRSRRPSRPVPGLVVAGRARLSTYRRVAAQAMDEAVLELGGLVAPSITDWLSLIGGRRLPRPVEPTPPAGPAGRSARRPGRAPAQPHGSVADELLQLVTERAGLARTVLGAEDYLAVEIHYAASHEGATELGDVLARRTRIAIDTDDGGHATAPGAAALLATILGWDGRETERQVEAYRRWLAGERRALRSPAE